MLIGTIAAYTGLGMGWIWFAVLFLAPDIGMVGYLAGPRRGALLYNTFHTYLLPVVLIGAGWYLSASTAVSIGLIWTAHIGMDRMLGYGLKRPTGFRDTHLGDMTELEEELPATSSRSET